MRDALALCLLPFLWGLGGGFSHCIGMCGIFVLSASGLNSSEGGMASVRKSLPRQALFHAGRLVSLAALGLAGGEIGSLAGFAARFARLQGWLSVSIGILMLLLALGYVGILPNFKIPEPDVLGAGGGGLRRLYARLLRSRHAWQPLGLGMLVGLLPCMQTYTVLIAAAGTQSIARGITVMVAFGLGTIPGLLLFGAVTGWFANFARGARFRIGMTRFSAVVMAVLALFFIWRGWPNLP